jgi:tetrahydromethanopterin S-methyltransferase subunit G
MSSQALEARMGGLEARMSHIDGAFEQVNDRLGGIERRLDSMEGRFEGRFNSIEDRFEGRFNSMDQRFAQIDQRFNWVIGTILGTWVTTILAILFHR